MVLIRLTLPLFCLPTNAGTVLGQWGLVGLPSYYEFLSDNPVLTRLNLKTAYGYTANLNGVSVSSTVATFCLFY